MTGRQAAAIFGGFYLVLSAAIIIRIAIELLFAGRDFRRASPSPSVRPAPDESHRTAIGGGGGDLWADFERTAR